MGTFEFDGIISFQLIKWLMPNDQRNSSQSSTKSVKPILGISAKCNIIHYSPKSSTRRLEPIIM